MRFFFYVKQKVNSIKSGTWERSILNWWGKPWWGSQLGFRTGSPSPCRVSPPARVPSKRTNHSRKVTSLEMHKYLAEITGESDGRAEVAPPSTPTAALMLYPVINNSNVSRKQFTSICFQGHGNCFPSLAVLLSFPFAIMESGTSPYPLPTKGFRSLK